MLPRRKLSEILVSSRVNKSFCNLMVEGPTDHVILRSFCEGARIPVVIYPVPSIEIDCLTLGTQGNRGHLIRISEFAATNAVERALCVIDRDDSNFVGFDFNSHCLITDLASLDMYALDIHELLGYVSRSFQFEMTAEQMSSIFAAAKSASCMQWKREALVDDVALASLDNSLSIVRNSLVRIDLADWLNRSRVRGGSRDGWDALKAAIPNFTEIEVADPRILVSVHLLDHILRFWLRRVVGHMVPEGWLEGHLRGLATYDRLKPFPFFSALESRCRIGIC
jgi:hypothetical protein